MPAVVSSRRIEGALASSHSEAPSPTRSADVTVDDITRLQHSFERETITNARSRLGGSAYNLEQSQKELEGVSGWGPKGWFSSMSGSKSALVKQVEAESRLTTQFSADVKAKEEALEVSRKLLSQAVTLEAGGDHAGAQQRLKEARGLLNPKSKIDLGAHIRSLKEVNEGLTSADLFLERTETGLRVVRDTTVVVGATVATVATAGTAGIAIGAAAGLGAGAAIGTASNLTEQSGHVAYGNKTMSQAASDGGRQLVQDLKTSATTAGSTAVAAPLAGRILGSTGTVVNTLGQGSLAGGISGAASTVLATGFDAASGQREVSASGFARELLKNTTAGAAGGAIGVGGTFARSNGASRILVTLGEGAADLAVGTTVEVADAAASGEKLTLEKLTSTALESVKGTIIGDVGSRIQSGLPQASVSAKSSESSGDVSPVPDRTGNVNEPDANSELAHSTEIKPAEEKKVVSRLPSADVAEPCGVQDPALIALQNNGPILNLPAGERTETPVYAVHDVERQGYVAPAQVAKYLEQDRRELAEVAELMSIAEGVQVTPKEALDRITTRMSELMMKGHQTMQVSGNSNISRVLATVAHGRRVDPDSVMHRLADTCGLVKVIHAEDVIPRDSRVALFEYTHLKVGDTLIKINAGPKASDRDFSAEVLRVHREVGFLQLNPSKQSSETVERLNNRLAGIAKELGASEDTFLAPPPTFEEGKYRMDGYALMSTMRGGGDIIIGYQSSPGVWQNIRLNRTQLQNAARGIFPKWDPENPPEDVQQRMYPTSPLQFWKDHLQS